MPRRSLRSPAYGHKQNCVLHVGQFSVQFMRQSGSIFDANQQARVETENRLTKQIAQTDSIKKRLYWRCDHRAGIEAAVLSGMIWTMQCAIAIVGVVKIPEGATFGWVLIAAAFFSGILRVAGVAWDIKPLKASAAFKEWRRSKLLEAEYASL